MRRVNRTPRLVRASALARALALTGAAALLLVAHSSTAAAQACESLIAFSSDREGGPGIYVVSPDGGEAKRIVAVPGALQIEWSPDGRRLAFLSVTPEDEELFEPFSGLRFHAFLYTVRADGEDLQRHGSFPISMGFSWSPDGRRIAFASAVETGGPTAIYVASLDGGKWERLTGGDGVYMFPAWSSDGRLIAFAAREGESTSLRVVDVEKREPRTVVEVSGSHAFKMFRPVWAPGSGMLAFSEGRAVFVVGALAGEPQNIAEGPGEPYGWSPSGRRLLIGEGAEGRARIFVVDLDTLEQTDLAHDAGAGGASTPSPGWDRVAYTAIEGEQAEVFVVGTEDGLAQNLTRNPANDYFPAWSPCLAKP